MKAALVDDSVTQFAVLDALLAGAYDSGMPVADALARGDFGIGCGEHLGGEVVVLDGEALRFTVDAAPACMTADETLPFAQVCRFPRSARVEVAASDTDALRTDVERRLLSRNLFHAVRVDGVFSSIRTRVTPPQQRAGETLADVAGRQVETVTTDAAGSLVGFWTPAIYQGIAVAGLHLHFIAADRSTGGHVLDVSIGSARLSIAAFSRFHLHLPSDPRFLRTELTHDDDHRIVAVES